MKMLFNALAACMALSPMLSPAQEALSPMQEDWKKEARAFVEAHGIPLMEVKPGTRLNADLARERWAWMQRVLWPVFEKHAQKWPEHSGRARSFLQQTLMASIGHPEMDRSRPPETLEKEGLALEAAGIDEPLVLYATAWAAWEWREGYGDARNRLVRAARHKALKDYPAAAPLLVRRLQFQIEDERNSEDRGHHEDFFKAALAAANDPASYSAAEDEILWLDTRCLFYQANLDAHRAELENLMRDRRHTPWMQEMMKGMFHLSSAWKARGTGFADTVTQEGMRKFDALMPVAATHFRAAWQMQPKRAVAAGQMVHLLRAGFAEDGETIQQWFERAVTAQFDFTEPVFDLVWAVRPRWGGSVEEIKAVLLTAAIADRPDTPLADTVLKLLAFVRSDSDASDENEVLQKDPLLRAAVMHTLRRLAAEPSRLWERPWRQADEALYAWISGLHEQAALLLEKVPPPFPRQTRRKITKGHNERSVRGEAALFSQDLGQEWAAAHDAYQRGEIFVAMEKAEQIAGRFPLGVPELVLELLSACDFELRLARREWIRLEASPDLTAWHRLSGNWSGSPDSTLSIEGHDFQGTILLAGRVGDDFEMRGEYTVEGRDPFQGLEVIVGHHRSGGRERFIACSQWHQDSESSTASLLRDFAQTQAPRTILRGADRTWRFHVFCRAGRVSYRLNHHDILMNHLDKNRRGEVFEMPEDGRVGFRGHYFEVGTTTHVRHVKIRRLREDEKAPAADVAGLHSLMAVEIEDRAAEARRAGRSEEAERITAFGRDLAKSAGEPVKLPDCRLEDEHLHALLRGYHQSIAARVPSPVQELKEVDLMAAENLVKWQRARGEWSVHDGVLHGSGDSIMNYDFGHAPPFQVEFGLTVREGTRPRLVMGRVKFANEGGKTTFGLYPQPKGQPLLSYEHGRSYQITVKALQDRTELHVDGVKACDGPKIDGVVELLQFRAGDHYSKGKAEFRNIRVGPVR